MHHNPCKGVHVSTSVMVVSVLAVALTVALMVMLMVMLTLALRNIRGSITEERETERGGKENPF